MSKFISARVENGLVGKDGYVTTTNQIVTIDDNGDITKHLDEIIKDLNASTQYIVNINELDDNNEAVWFSTVDEGLTKAGTLMFAVDALTHIIVFDVTNLGRCYISQYVKDGLTIQKAYIPTEQGYKEQQRTIQTWGSYSVGDWVTLGVQPVDFSTEAGRIKIATIDGVDIYIPAQIEAADVNVPIASNNTVGGIKVGYTQTSTKLAVKLDDNNFAYVELPTSYISDIPSATNTTLGGIRTGFLSTGNAVGVKTDSKDNAYVEIPSSYLKAVPAATNSAIGGIKVGYTAANKTIPISLNTDNQGYVDLENLAISFDGSGNIILTVNNVILATCRLDDLLTNLALGLQVDTINKKLRLSSRGTNTLATVNIVTSASYTESDEIKELLNGSMAGLEMGTLEINGQNTVLRFPYAGAGSKGGGIITDAVYSAITNTANNYITIDADETDTEDSLSFNNALWNAIINTTWSQLAICVKVSTESNATKEYVYAKRLTSNIVIVEGPITIEENTRRVAFTYNKNFYSALATTNKTIDYTAYKKYVVYAHNTPINTFSYAHLIGDMTTINTQFEDNTLTITTNTQN